MRYRHTDGRRRRAPGTGVVGWLARLRRAIDGFRIREHLRRTERALRAADPDGCSPERRRRRERTLDRLAAYRRRGTFPTNRTGEGRAPRFVGADGTPCAVAHLLLAAGRDDLVRSVAAADNGTWLETVEDEALLDAIEDVGLTRAEAARIQPTYPESVHLATTCGPVPCWLAGIVASIVGVAAFAVAEFVGYRLVGGLFPENALKRRGALAYLTVMNLLAAPLVAALVYALFP